MKFKKIVIQFATKVLGSEKPDNKCLAVCCPLTLYLKGYQIPNSLVSGWIKDRAHYAIKLDDHTDTFIDPTTQQFYNDRQNIFFGSHSDYNSFTSVDFLGIVNIWRDSLTKETFSPFKRQNPSDIKEVVQLSARAAKVLSKENIRFKMHNEDKKLYDKYFGALYSIINSHPEIKQNLMSSNELPDFEFLLNNETKIL